jgi:hypothetical protein
MQQIKKLYLAITIGLVVASCGAGGGPTAGIDRGGITSGPVTGYGSVWVNGARYRTDEAAIKVNGVDATEDELKIGQVVVLNSIISGTTLSAERIVYESNLQGPVESVNVLAGSFVALGQEVMVDAGTSFGVGIVPADLTGLMADYIVEVSGLVDTTGQITATRIEKETAPYEVQLSGVVRNLVAGVQFTIGTQIVDYRNAGMVDGFTPAGEISNGDRVRVVVMYKPTVPQFGAGGEILATAIAYRGSPVVTEDAEDGDIEGLITDFASPASFRLAGFAVETNTETKYSGGKASDLGNNIRIEAEGVFDATGTLVADEIEFREEGEALIEAVFDAVGEAPGTLTVFGIPVATTPLTTLEDKVDETNKPFYFDKLVPGSDFLKISGTWDGSKFIATKLERIGGEDKFKLRGQITAADNPAFTLLGKNIQTAEVATNFEIADVGGQTRTGFFNAITVCLPTAAGCLAEIAWAANGPLSVADEVALED